VDADARARMVSQGGSYRVVSEQPARKTNDANADGEVVWSWHPLLMPSLCGGEVGPTGFGAPAIRGATVTRGIRRRGEHEGNR